MIWFELEWIQTENHSKYSIHSRDRFQKYHCYNYYHSWNNIENTPKKSKNHYDCGHAYIDKSYNTRRQALRSAAIMDHTNKKRLLFSPTITFISVLSDLRVLLSSSVIPTFRFVINRTVLRDSRLIDKRFTGT